MSSFLTILLIGISLSMDAFSLSLAYGVIGLSYKKKTILSIIVGIYHFIMPLMGLIIGLYIGSISYINFDIVALIILLYIGLDLILSSEDSLSISRTGLLMFGLSVSIDSFAIGIGLNAITGNYSLALITFAMCSFLFTYLGLLIGNRIGNRLGTYSRIVGGIILVVMAIIIFIT